MRRVSRRLLGLFLAALLSVAPAAATQQAPSKYVVPQALFDAVAAEYSGEHALDNVRSITQFHRIQASPGFTQAREWVVARLASYGITDVQVEKFPSDGRTRYSTYVGPMAWTVREGELWVEAPFRERLCRFTDQPVCLSTLSNGGEWRGEAIDVGRGTDAASYEGREVRAQIVFASGYAGAVHREAVLRRGAVGVVIYPAADDRPEYSDLVRYNGLWVQAEEKEKAGFGFQISHRQWERLKPQVAAGKLALHAKVDAELHPGALEVTSAYLRGSAPSQEIILVAHLDHHKFGANDNASGSASLLGIARTVKTLLDQKKILPLKRTLHFMWVPEHFGTIAWLTKHPEVTGRAIAAINMDMVGENLVKTNSRLNIARTPDSLPSFLNDLVENVAEQVEEANLVSPNGSRNLFHWLMTPYSAGSDHDMFNDGNVRVPAVQLGHWPDWTHHTNEDTVDKVDSTTLRRCGVLATAAAVWMATASDEEAMRLLPLVASAVPMASSERSRRAGSIMLAFSGILVPPTPEKTELTPEQRARMLQRMRRQALLGQLFRRAIHSLEDLMTPQGREKLQQMIPVPSQQAAAKSLFGEAVVPQSMQRVPRKKYIGPIADGPSSPWFRQTLGADYAWWREQAGKFRQGDLIPQFDLIVYEAGNFADGKRTLAEIEDAVAAEYGELPPGIHRGPVRPSSKSRPGRMGRAAQGREEVAFHDAGLSLRSH
ncbi:MAG: DUF4910 domain-containing protein [Acidobacteria bacterium]|nr:DUF4910 domain-containing protein [Acidobacteriota bacterium]